MERVTCPLCGHRFDAAAATVCGGCPLSKRCTRTCCPHCGYEMAPQSAIMTWIRNRLLKRRTAA